MNTSSQSIRRISADSAALPPGATPPGTSGRILNAALERFAELGFHGTSIRDIASDVGINSATLYAHFPSKEGILRELVMIGITELDKRLSRAVDEADGAHDELAALVRADVQCHATYPLLAVVTNNELHALSGDAAVQAREFRRRLQSMAVEIVQRGIVTGEFRTFNPDLAVRAIADMVIRVGNWFDEEQQDVDAVATAYVDFALRIVDAR